MSAAAPLADPVLAGPAYRERTFLSQDGLRLYFRDYGDPLAGATPVLCLPGLTRNAKDFHDLALRLGAHRRVLCPDYRGRGRSARDPDWRRYEPRTYIDDLRHLLAVVNVHRVAVIGTSLGGLLAMAMAVAMPCAVAAVVLNDVGPTIDVAGIAPILAYMKALGRPASMAEAADILRRTFPDLPARSDADWLTIAERTFRETPAGLEPDWDRAIVKPLARIDQAPPDLWAMFGALRRVPAVAVRGAKSKLFSEATFRRMAEAMPGLRQVTIGDCGHAPALNEPEALEAIDELLARADATAHP